MLDFFANPGYLALGAALISVPIIIHLINRLRYKRLRWAAMEFLLKAQKRSRRRLIIEQLLLLALRCLLVAMLGVLVARLLDFDPADLWTQIHSLITRGELAHDTTSTEAGSHLYVFMVDDTLSMQDGWKEGDTPKTAFGVAKDEVLKRVKKLAEVRTPNRLMLIPLSQLALDPDAAPKVYDRLNDTARHEEVKREIDKLEPTELHVDMLQAMKTAQQVIANNANSRVHLFIFSDFRQKDWGLPSAEGLHKLIVDTGTEHKKHLSIHLVDTIHPYRNVALGGYPQAHDNVGIVDLRPSTRIAGKNMPVNFIATLANYSGREVEVKMVVYDETKGALQHEINFSPTMPIKLAPGSNATVTFEHRFQPQIKADETHFAHISARLLTPQLQPLPNDGLLQDNSRHAAVEIREKVPVLVIDGEGSKGRDESRDSFFISRALISVPGASYQVVYGDELGGGIATKALERADLHRYPSIFLLNVRDLTPKQQANLEAFVREGGGVAFFMGPLVSPRYYNKELYKDGKGLFPAPLKDSYYPPSSEEPIPTKASDTPQLLLRDNLFPDLRSYPIFGAMFEKPEHRDPLKDLPIHRYFQIPRGAWKKEAGRTLELATLPNDQGINPYQKRVLDLLDDPELKTLTAAEGALQKYRKGLDRHFAELKKVVGPGSEKKAYQLASALDALLTDQGKEKDRENYPNLTEFWSTPLPKIESLRRAATDLREEARFGDPFVVAHTFGKGRVVAVMSTAGKEWNDWGGSSGASLLYTPFLWEMQNFLSSQGAEGNWTVGTPITLTMEAEPYRQKNEPLRLDFLFSKPREGKPAETVKLESEDVRETNGIITSRFAKTVNQGLYISQLRLRDEPSNKGVLATFGRVFNIDTPHEGPLQRVSQDELDRELAHKLPETIRIESPDSVGDDLIEGRKDFSESKWYFLLFLVILIAEQALAVHLSFHLKGSENETLTKVTKVG